MLIQRLPGPQLSFPAGAAARLNRKHVAAPSVLFLAYPNGANFVSALQGARPGTLVGASITSGVDKSLGQSTLMPSQSVSITAACTFANNSATNYTSSTIAAFVKFTTTAGVSGTQWIFSSANNSTGVALNINGTQIQWTMFGVAAENSGLNVVAGVPYFMVASQSPSNINYLLLRLDNGTMVTATSGSNTPAAPNGTFVVGNAPSGNNTTEGRLGPVMFSAAYLSMSQLMQWAADPWGLWYSRGVGR